MDAMRSPPARQRRETLYAQACDSLAPALARLARSVEADADRARDLEQDIHVALWRSLEGFDGRCALATWVYRVAHNAAASHAARGARSARLVALEDAETLVADDDPEAAAGRSHTLARLRRLIGQLKPADRSVMLLWLEGLDAAAIGEVTGLSANHVSVKLHRLRGLLASRFAQGETP